MLRISKSNNGNTNNISRISQLVYGNTRNFHGKIRNYQVNIEYS